MTLNPEITDGLLRYLAIREHQRADEVQEALARLSVPERRLMREAAVMGYVRGSMAGAVAARDGQRPEIPPDSEIVAEVVECCQSMDDLYPFIAGLTRRRKRGTT